MARIKKPPFTVRFTYPDGQVRRGKVKAATEIKIQPGAKAESAEYASRIELIDFEDGQKCIRFAYWRRPNGKKGEDDWHWASQTTWAFDQKTTREAVREAEKIGLF